MAGTMKCAHPACNCTIDPKGPFGKYCSEHCKQAGDKTELRCDCQHAPCRWRQESGCKPWSAL